jgi:hypothetical protein
MSRLRPNPRGFDRIRMVCGTWRQQSLTTIPQWSGPERLVNSQRIGRSDRLRASTSFITTPLSSDGDQIVLAELPQRDADVRDAQT